MKLGEHKQEVRIPSKLLVAHCPPFLHRFGEHGVEILVVITFEELTQLPW